MSELQQSQASDKEPKLIVHKPAMEPKPKPPRLPPDANTALKLKRFLDGAIE